MLNSSRSSVGIRKCKRVSPCWVHPCTLVDRSLWINAFPCPTLGGHFWDGFHKLLRTLVARSITQTYILGFHSFLSYPHMSQLPHGIRFSTCLVVLVQSLSHVCLFAAPRTAACQASLSFTISWSLPNCTKTLVLGSDSEETKTKTVFSNYIFCFSPMYRDTTFKILIAILSFEF